MSGAPRRDAYDEVRDRLLERGYLDTPLERLFLGGPGGPLGRGRRGPLAGALLAALLAGPALGVLLALVLVAGERGVPAWPDGVLYALLFAPVLGLIVGAAELVATGVIRLVARARPAFSARRASLVAGLVVAGALSLYLGAWWVRTGGGLRAPELLALGALALGAGFTGRVVSAAALAQALAATGRAPRKPTRAALGIGALALALTLAAAVAALAASRAEGAGQGAPVTRADEAPARAIFIAWDGLSADLARGLLREGEMPWLSTLAASGHVRRVVVERGLDPAAAWTTVATGCWPEVHGVAGAGVRALRGASAPAPQGGLVAGPMELLTRLWPTEKRAIRSGVRRVPALWEIAADARKVAVSNWWGTWPAGSPGAAGGYVVSDGALVAAREGHGLSESVYPPAFGEGRAARWLAFGESLAGALDGGEGLPAALLSEALVTDAFALAALEEAVADPEVEAAFVYLPGLDILEQGWRELGEDLLARVDAARVYARVLDIALADLVGDAANEETLVTLLALPGRARGGEGLLFVAPVPAGPGAEGEEAPLELVEIAPTWLALAGYTIDERVCAEADEALVAALPWPPERRPTRAEASAPARGQGALEPELLERLRSLGYVQ